MKTAIRRLTMQSHMPYSSCFVCLTGSYKCVYLVLEQVKFGYLSTILSFWPLDVQHDTSWQITLWGFENYNCCSPQRTELQYSGQGHTEVFQEGFHSEQTSQGSIKDVESLCCVSGVEAGFKKQTHECCQHWFRGCRSGTLAFQYSDLGL